MSFIPPYQETAAILAAQNPLVPRGVLASETDTGVIKVGDGVTRYNSLSTALSGTYPRVYGVAAPTGVAATDLANIQAKIDACSTAGGGTVQLQAGTYVTSAAIVPKSNVTLRGLGSASAIQPNFNGHAITSSASVALSNFTVEAIKFVGPVSNTVSVPTRARTTSGAGMDIAIYIDGSLDTTGSFPVITNITVRDVIVTGATWLPVRLFGITGKVEVTGSLFYNCMDVGFGFNEEVICSNNTSIMSADNGFSISRGNKKVTCTGNTVENAAYYGIWLSGFLSSVGPEDFSCTGNTVRGCGNAGIVLMDAPSYGVVSGNTIDKMYYRGEAGASDDTTCCGIWVKGDSTSAASPSQFSKGILIADNTIRSAPRFGIYLNGAVAVKVTGNLIIDTGTQFFADGTTAITSSFTTQNVGIYIDQTSTVTYSDISDNLVIDTRGTPYCNWGIVPTAVASVSMQNNRMVLCRNSSTLPVTVRSDTLGRIAFGQETMPRWAAGNSSGITMSTGVVRFAYFTADRNETVSKISLTCGNTAAAATPTLIKYGLYSVAANGDLAQVGVTASDTTMLAATLTPYQKAMTGSVTVTQGQQYAIAAIVVTGAAAPTVMGVLPVSGGDLSTAPRLSGVLTAQADLSASYTSAQVANTQSLFYANVTP